VRGRDPSKLPSSPAATRASVDRLVRPAVRHAELRRPRRLLLGQHGGGGLYTFGGSFWEFGEPDWSTPGTSCCSGGRGPRLQPAQDRARQAEGQGVKVVAVNPIRTGYGAIADEWIGIKARHRWAVRGSLIHELMRTQKVDLEYLARFTNASWLVIDDPDAPTTACSHATPTASCSPSTTPPARSPMRRASNRAGAGRLVQAARWTKARPAFAPIVERFLGNDYAPDKVAAACAISAGTIRRIAGELAHAAFEQQVTLDIP